MKDYRQQLLSKSILQAVFASDDGTKQNKLVWFRGLFALFDLRLARWRAILFMELRSEVWQIEEIEYKESFRLADRKGKLVSVGDLGYSGSTFLSTPDSKFLIKSLPRRFEYDFFKTELLVPYTDHMHSHPHSLLVRITDFLYAPSWSLGRLLGTAPSHHIVMENILHGRKTSPKPEDWETYDLKPSDYFFPERDVASGHLAPQSVKDRLIDEFNDKVRVSEPQRTELLSTLEADTELLKSANVVDYSFFLVRYPTSSQAEDVPSPRSRPSSWRSGVRSVDGKWIYRAVLLDFFWAKHALQARALEGLVQAYNVVDNKGPMSITTTPEEYQKRFLGMVKDMVEVVAGEEVNQ